MQSLARKEGMVNILCATPAQHGASQHTELTDPLDQMECHNTGQQRANDKSGTLWLQYCDWLQ
jgi:hypothetical protein